MIPLAERRGDVLAIAASPCCCASTRMHNNGGEFVWPTAECARTSLLGHEWPGNARELGNVLQRALVLRDGDRIAVARSFADVPPGADGAASDDSGSATLSGAAAAPEPIYAPAQRGRPTRLQDIARASKLDAVRHALREADGHRALAARKLGISERTLRYRLAELRDDGTGLRRRKG
jgi:two-component system response regulator FlrC